MEIRDIKTVGEFSYGKLIEKSDVTEGGLALPDSVGIDAYDMVKVLGIGEGRIYNDGWLPLRFKVGDVVLVYKGRTDKVNTKNGEIVIFRSTDVTAMVE